MSKIVQWKRGNVTVNDTYTGANGEITIDTTNWNLRVHDGVTAGGYTISSSQGDATIGGNLIVTGNATISSLEINNRSIITANGDITIASQSNVVANSYFANTSFYVNTTNQLGYLFDTGTPGISGLLHYNENGDTVIGIDHDGNQVAKFYDSNTTILIGNLEVRQSADNAQTLPNAFLQVTGNVDSYLQAALQNLSSDAFASADFVVTAPNGNDESYYIDMGMASNNYAISGFEVVGPNDGYLYVAGSSYLGPVSNTANLNLGSTTGAVRTWVGQGTLANVVTTASETGFTVNKGAFVVAANSAPAANNSTGVAGTIAWDSDYIYVCVATDTWKRANLSTW